MSELYDREAQQWTLILAGWVAWQCVRAAASQLVYFDGHLMIGPVVDLMALLPPFLFFSCAASSMEALPRASINCATVADRRRMQSWTDCTYIGFILAFVSSTFAVVCLPRGLGSWLANWLMASARDAKLPMQEFFAKKIEIFGICEPHKAIMTSSAAQSTQFELLISLLLGFVLVTVLTPTATRLAGFLTAFCKNMNGQTFATIHETYLRTLRAPRTYLQLREPHPLIKNAALTLWWLAGCYGVLFWLVGFSGGPLGIVITRWLDACIASAHTNMVYGASANPHLRMFCGAIVALYGTVPLAVTGSTFLPYARRRQLILTTDGIFLPDGPYAMMRLRPLRLWGDFARVDLHGSTIKIDFHTGGSAKFKLHQLDDADLEKLLAAIDEHGSQCEVSDAILNLRERIRKQMFSSSVDSSPRGSTRTQEFQSTIFLPQEPGTWLPDGETRVVRLLAARPLSCVYLVRSASGNLAIAKQFFLSEDLGEQSDALRKCFEREYELLAAIEHPSISKVLSMFHSHESTYLLLEHASGTDLHTLVTEEGPRSEELVLTWAEQLCEIMMYLHSQSPPIVHRDLTPDNIVVAEDGTLRIIDFGAAHQFLEGITGTIIGKQCYVSPEQLRGEAGPLADVYSFGCTLHFLLTGQEPVALTQCTPSKDLDVSAELGALVAACTEFREEDRPASFAAIKEQLASIREINRGAVVTFLKDLVNTTAPVKTTAPAATAPAATAPAVSLVTQPEEQVVKS